MNKAEAAPAPERMSTAGGHKIASIEITPADTGGGHVVRKRFKSKPVKRSGAMHSGIESHYKEPEEAVFGKGQDKEMMAHVAHHLGIGGAVKAQADD